MRKMKNARYGGEILDINQMKALSYDELRYLYKMFLQSQDFKKSTVNTSCHNSFYLWEKGSKELFWAVVTSSDFESIAKKELLKLLSENSTGNINSLVNNYMSHLRRFRLFLYSDGPFNISTSSMQKWKERKSNNKSKIGVYVPPPSSEQLYLYLEKWKKLENYSLQEDALNKLFFELCPKNNDIVDILLKASSLNAFYSTNIFSIYPVAKHIHQLNIDTRLESGDVTLVGDIQYVTIGNTLKNFYSFASKYCSHHNPLDYPIYDSYVDEVLRYFRNRDSFSDFQDGDLKDYVKFKGILIDFRAFYGLNRYNLKQIDQYVWQLGKDYFPKNYGKKKRGDK